MRVHSLTAAESPNRAQRRSRKKADGGGAGPVIDDPFVSAQYIEKLTGCGNTQARRIMQCLPRVVLGRKCIRVRLSDVLAYLAAREVAPVGALNR